MKSRILPLTCFCLLPAILFSAQVVTLSTNVGEIRVRLFPAAAPGTVENFLRYVKDGDFDGSFIHRSVPEFVIQGGGFYPDGTPVPTDPPISNEFGRSNLRGTVAMAKLGGDPDSATSQWFVNLGDNSENLDSQNGGFTVFGEVIEGMDVVDRIAAFDLWDLSQVLTSIADAVGSVPLTDQFVNGETPLTPEVFVVVNQATVDLFADAAIGNKGWLRSDWFGVFSDSFAPWIYHEKLGFLFPAADRNESAWFFDPENGWIWTSESAYPFFWSVDRNAWIWFAEEGSTPGARWFNDFSTGQWFKN